MTGSLGSKPVTSPRRGRARRWRPGLRCDICGEVIHFWQQLSVDHRVPASLGGSRGRRNKVAAHQLCNNVKGARMPFSLRTHAEREALRHLVRPATYQRLERLWAGHCD